MHEYGSICTVCLAANWLILIAHHKEAKCQKHADTN